MLVKLYKPSFLGTLPYCGRSIAKLLCQSLIARKCFPFSTKCLVDLLAHIANGMFVPSKIVRLWEDRLALALSFSSLLQQLLTSI